MTVSRKRITEYITKIAHSAQTSNYQVFFDGLSGELTKFLSGKGVDNRFIIEEAGLRCSSASIPGSSLATANIAGNYMGVQEKMVHSRIFTEMSLEFYVDRDYKVIKFFEYSSCAFIELTCSSSSKIRSLFSFNSWLRILAASN